MLEQWAIVTSNSGNSGKRLTAGQRLDPADVSYLAQLGAPIIVVTNASVVDSEGFDTARYARIYEEADLRYFGSSLANIESDKKSLRKSLRNARASEIR